MNHKFLKKMKCLLRETLVHITLIAVEQEFFVKKLSLSSTYTKFHKTLMTIFLKRAAKWKNEWEDGHDFIGPSCKNGYFSKTGYLKL